MKMTQGDRWEVLPRELPCRPQTSTENSEETVKATRQELGWRMGRWGCSAATAAPCFPASRSVLWPLIAQVMWLNEEIPEAELELKQMEILSGFLSPFLHLPLRGI